MTATVDENTSFVTIRTSDPKIDPIKFAVRTQFLEVAREWSYVLQNRRRWPNLGMFYSEVQEQARQVVAGLDLPWYRVEQILNEPFIEVSFPDIERNEGWGTKIFPWEHVFGMLALALDGNGDEADVGTFPADRKQMTVVRHLSGTISERMIEDQVPIKLLIIASNPGPIRDFFNLEAECRTVIKSLELQPDDTLNVQVLRNPSLTAIRSSVTAFRPTVVHLAGIDNHQAAGSTLR